MTRQRNLAMLVMGLVVSEAIHLSQIVSEWPLWGRDVSLVKRLRRFLANGRVCVAAWYAPVARQLLAPFAGSTVRLVIDCTKVGFGHRKRTLPLAWRVHEGRQGHVATSAQIALLKQVHALVPAHTEVWLMGDAGFQHVPLLRWLQQQGWHFVIRQQGRITIRQAGQRWQKLNTLPLVAGESYALGWVHLTHKYNAGPFWLLLHWAQGEDEPWYLLSDQSGHRSLLRLYKKCMWIEEMFGDVKGHGFALEATHLSDTQRIERLLLGVCLASLSLCLGRQTWLSSLHRQQAPTRQKLLPSWS